MGYILGLQQKAHHYLAAGLGSFGYEPKVDYFFGFPRSIEAGGAVMNVPIVNITAIDSLDPEAKKNYVLQRGMLSSALEHAVPEQMFVTPENPGEAISAVKALFRANCPGPTYLPPDSG